MLKWTQVVFTDELHFEVRPIKRNIGVSHKDGERYSTECMLCTFKYEYDRANIWRRFSLAGRAPLNCFESTFKNPQYKEVCLNGLFLGLLYTLGTPRTVHCRQMTVDLSRYRYPRIHGGTWDDDDKVWCTITRSNSYRERLWWYKDTRPQTDRLFEKPRWMLPTSSRTMEQFAAELISRTHRFNVLICPRGTR